jgi:opacity protein-like surface antigen
MKNAPWAALAVGFSLVSTAAMAQSDTGFYIRGGGGAAMGADMTFTDVNSSDPSAALGPGGQINGKTDTGALAVAGIGYKFSPFFWADVTGLWLPDLSFKNGNSNAAAVNIPTLQGGSAKIDTMTAMVNGYVDVAKLFRLPFGNLQPYVMGGVGYSRNHIGTISGTVPVAGLSSESFTGTTHNELAWGAGAGIGIPLGSRLVVDIGYEYLDLGEVRTGGTGSLAFTSGSPITVTAAPMKADLRVHTLQVSLRFGF